jgi:hypothetical protein
MTDQPQPAHRPLPRQIRRREAFAFIEPLDEDTTAALREIAGGGEAPTFFDRRAAKDPSVDHDSHSTCWTGPCPECQPEIAGGDQ